MNDDLGVFDILGLISGILLLVGVGVLWAIPADALKPASKFKLSSGEQVECRQARRESCGLNLTDCVNSQEYFCQTNAIQIK